MKNHQDVLEKFDFVLDNSPDDVDVQQIEKEIREDKQLQAEFEEHKFMVEGIRQASRKKLLESLRAWDTEVAAHSTQKVFFSSPTWYYAAASIAVIFVVAYTLTTFLTSDTDRLIAEYYQPYLPVSELTRGDGVNGRADLFDAYQKGDYQKVIEIYKPTGNAGDQVMTDFLYANACQAREMFAEAMPVFGKIASSDHPLAPAASWYLAICHISQGHTEEGIAIFRELSTTKSSYAVKARSLVEDLEK